MPVAITRETTSASAPLVVGCVDGRVSSTILREPERTEAERLLDALGAPSAPNAVTRIVSRGTDYRQIIAVAIPAEATPQSLREAAGAAVRATGAVPEVVVDVPHDSPDSLAAIAEGSALGAHRFVRYKSGAEAETKVSIVTPFEISAKAETLALAQCAVRDLVDTPGADLLPADLAGAAVDLVSGLDVRARSWREDELEREGCGGLLGVGRGSSHPPIMLRLDWDPVGARRRVALVGKGITFDSGGMSLKSHGGLVDMKTDMAGAATVAAVVYACARLRLPVRVTAWLCIAENMLSGSSMRVGDVLRMADGTTVEVTNTDAEGRLVLADGLAVAVRERPDEVIDVATLTGAQIRALGNRYAGLMGSDSLVSDIASAAEAAGEHAWAMPLPAYLRSQLESPVADIRNSAGPEAGMLKAGLFLREFVGQTPWAHLDIAGPSFNPGDPWGCTPRGATGYGVRTLLSHVEDLV